MFELCNRPRHLFTWQRYLVTTVPLEKVRISRWSRYECISRNTERCQKGSGGYIVVYVWQEAELQNHQKRLIKEGKLKEEDLKRSQLPSLSDSEHIFEVGKVLVLPLVLLALVPSFWKLAEPQFHAENSARLGLFNTMSRNEFPLPSLLCASRLPHGLVCTASEMSQGSLEAAPSLWLRKRAARNC